MALKSWALAVALGLLALPVVAADEKKAKPPELAGKYDCSGNGGSYTGTVEISEDGAGYKVEWTIGNDSYGGVGIWEGERLCVSWKTSDGGTTGIAVYSRDKDGTLKGKWTAPGGAKLIDETLTPKKK